MDIGKNIFLMSDNGTTDLTYGQMECYNNSA